MMKKNLSRNRVIQLLAIFLLLISLLSVMVWVIKTDQTAIGDQVILITTTSCRRAINTRFLKILRNHFLL